MRAVWIVRVVTAIVLTVVTVLVGGLDRADAAQVCGCKRLTTGRVNRITAGVVPTCPTSRTLVCWNDETSSGTVTEITTGDGLQATPTNPITGTGTISVDAPVCSGTSDKLTWDGSDFQCEIDEDTGGTDISARVFNSQPVSIVHDTVTALSFDSERWDTDAIHESGANPSRLTAQTPGKYYIFATITWDTNAAGGREMRVKLNGTSQVLTSTNTEAFTSGSQRQSVGTHYELSSGDYVECEVLQRSGGLLNVQGAANHPAEFGMVKLP